MKKKKMFRNSLDIKKDGKKNKKEKAEEKEIKKS